MQPKCLFSPHAIDSQLQLCDGSRLRYLSSGVHRARAVVFEGPEDYHERINSSDLQVDEGSMLFIRNVGPVGFPGDSSPGHLKAGFHNNGADAPAHPWW